MLDLVSAIKHCEEKAKELHDQEIAIDIDGCEIMDYECEKCAREYEQIAEWLKELAEYQKLFESPKEAEEVLNMMSV